MSVKVRLLIGILLLVSVVIAGIIVFSVRMNDVMPGIVKTSEAKTIITIVTATPLPTQAPYPSVTPFK